MHRLHLARIPLVLGAAFVAACFVVTVWNLSVAAVFPRLAIRNWTQLYGLSEEKPPSLSLATFLSGDVQTALSRKIGTSLPIYAPAVRLKNQIEYSIFGLPNAPSIAFGRDKHLYEWPYINEYCGRTGKADPAAWGDKIKDIQNYAAAHGKAFAYVKPRSIRNICPPRISVPRRCAAR